MYYETTTTLYRDEHTREVYRDKYHGFCEHYGFKACVEGGWIFFEFATDYNTWHNQR